MKRLAQYRRFLDELENAMNFEKGRGLHRPRGMRFSVEPKWIRNRNFDSSGRRKCDEALPNDRSPSIDGASVNEEKTA